MKGHKVIFPNVPFGIIPANTTNTNIVTLPSGTPFELIHGMTLWSVGLCIFTIPAGMIFRLNVVEGSTDQIAIYTTNTTSSAIDLDTTKYLLAV